MPQPLVGALDPAVLTRLGGSLRDAGVTHHPLSLSSLRALAASISRHGLTLKATDPHAFQVLTFTGLLLVEVSYLPQIARLHRMKEAREFHVLYPLLNAFGRVIVFVAGILLHQPGITLGMAIGIVIRLILLGQVGYYRYRENRERQIRLEQVSV